MITVANIIETILCARKSLSMSCALSYFSSQQPFEDSSPFYRKRKPRHREAKSFLQGHTAPKSGARMESKKGKSASRALGLDYPGSCLTVKARFMEWDYFPWNFATSAPSSLALSP